MRSWLSMPVPNSCIVNTLIKVVGEWQESGRRGDKMIGLWHGVPARGEAWQRVVRRGEAWRGMAWHGVAWRGMAWHGST